MHVPAALFAAAAEEPFLLTAERVVVFGTGGRFSFSGV